MAPSFVLLCIVAVVHARCWGYGGRCNDEESAAMCQSAQAAIDTFSERLLTSVALQNATAPARLIALRPLLDCSSSIACYTNCNSYSNHGCQNAGAYAKCTGAGARLLAFVATAPGVIGAPVPPYLVELAAELAAGGWKCTRNELACDYNGSTVSSSAASVEPLPWTTGAAMALAFLCAVASALW